MPQAAALGWVILYVPDGEEALSVYDRAFGLKRGFLDANAAFGQLETGQTALAFASEKRAEHELRGQFLRPRADSPPFNVELCLVGDDPYEAFQQALAVGCTAVAEPEPKPRADCRLCSRPVREPRRDSLPAEPAIAACLADNRTRCGGGA